MTFDWVVGILTLITWWMAGDDKWYAYIVGSVTQVCWIIYGVYYLKSVPITVMAVVLWVVLLRNMVKSFKRNNPDWALRKFAKSEREWWDR